MRPKEHQCERRCRYRGNGWPDASSNGCDYALITKHSRLKIIMDRLGTDKLTPEVHELMKPANCPFFERGERKKTRTGPVNWEERDV